jgi:hypothetical protein
MKVLELMHSLEEAYDRFGDIEVAIYDTKCGDKYKLKIKELIIESEEFIIKCE